MSLENEKLKIQQVIAFLIDNEQYGDDWKEHIDILQKVCDEIKSIQHDDFQADAEMQEMKTEQIIEERDEEPEMPEGGWECSECGAPVNNMNDYCSQGCFNAGMR